MAITYYATITTLANGIHIGIKERQLDTSAPATTTDLSGNIAGGATDRFLWTTQASNPNQADWGNGTYGASLVVSAVGADISYGFRTIGAEAGHFARVDSGLTTDSETATQTEAAFTGTGTKSASVTWNPAAGASSDRFEALCALSNAGSMNQSITFDVGSAGTTFTGAFNEVAGGTYVPARHLPMLGVG